MSTRGTQSPTGVPIGRQFPLALIKAGDRVRLRFTGERPVPYSLGDTWASVVQTAQHATQWRVTTKIAVDLDQRVGAAPRRISLDQVGAVERGGVLVAERRQGAPGEFPLVAV